MLTIGIIGGGNMGSAILSRIRNHFRVAVWEKDPQRRAWLRRRFPTALQDLNSLVASAQVLVLAVKPQDFDALLREVKETISTRSMVVSIAAGITTRYIEKRLSSGIRVIRTMPNLPVLVGQGITAICKGRYARDRDVQLACRILNHMGQTVVVPEGWLDAVTVVSGSGPGYVFLFVECLEKAACQLGLKPEVAQKLIKATLMGSAQLYMQQKELAATLRSKVTSQGGTTEAAMRVFFKRKIDQIFRDALWAAHRRAKELSKS